MFEATSLQSTPCLPTCPCQSVNRWGWMPNMVLLSTRCILKCLLLTPGHQINYCPDLYVQDSILTIRQLHYKAEFYAVPWNAFSCISTVCAKKNVHGFLDASSRPYRPCKNRVSRLIKATVRSYSEIMINKRVLRASFTTLSLCLSVHLYLQICHIFYAKVNTRRDTVQTHHCPVGLVVYHL